MKRLQNLAVRNRVYTDETRLRGFIRQATNFCRMRSRQLTLPTGDRSSLILPTQEAIALFCIS
ncbi:hypothetical protein [Coleofasciculus sp. H7-2]|uniref:hypothetical protein n=1 Tax=Coleofasciculus sp. H7-2 TaxID=3351545 RepID=UPI00366EB09B